MAKSPNSSSNDDFAQLNTPPHSLEAEQAVLGSVIQSVDAWDKIAEVIIQEDFYNRAHRLIFAAINRLITKNSAADPITLKDELESNNELEDIGGFSYIVNLARNTPSSSNITAYANIVRERAIVRELIGVANDIADASFNPEGRDSKDLLDLAETKVFEIAEKRTAANEGPVSVSSALRKTIKRIEELSGQDKDVTGVSTGFTDLDKKTSGMQPSDLIIVAARPSMGKCIVSGSSLVDPNTGAMVTIDHMVATKRANLSSIDHRFKLIKTRASAFVDDGLKPVFKVTTALGKTIQTTLSHPFLTGRGWRPLSDIECGEHIAVPRVLPIFGKGQMDTAKIDAAVEATRCNDQADGKRRSYARKLREALQEKIADVCLQSFDSLQCLIKPLDVAPYHLTYDHLTYAHLPYAHSSYERKHVHQNAYSPLCDTVYVGKRFSGPMVGDSIQSAFALNEPKNLDDCDMALAPEMFCLTKPQLAYLISALFEEHGHICYTQKDSATSSKTVLLSQCDSNILDTVHKLVLGFTHPSATLVQQVQHLLLRFGVLSRFAECSDESQIAQKARLEIISERHLAAFVNAISPAANQDSYAVLNAYVNLSQAQGEPAIEPIPSSVIDYIAALKGELSWQALFAEQQLDCPRDLDDSFGVSASHQGSTGLSREQLALFAQLFNDDYLSYLAGADVYWDQVCNIEYTGYQQVYDLTVPEVHNFIAQDICVHNTTFAMNLVENALMLETKPVLVFSLEMPAEQIMMRMLASLSRVDQTAIRTARLEDTDWAKIQSSVRMLNEKDNLFIDDSSGLTPMEVRTRARKLARDRGGISMIMVDYLQLMRVPSLSENRTLEIAEISRSLKALAKELECPVIALSQLNRGLEQRADKRPINSDLRESGAIEQDADLIMFIYRDEVYHENSELQGIAEIIIGKQRNGPIGTTRLTFQGRFSRFENYAGPQYDDE